MNPRKIDKVEQFKAWLVARGAELLHPTSEWEIVRFRGEGVTSIVYRNKKDTWTFTGIAGRAWQAFSRRDDSFRIVPRAPRSGGWSTKLPPLIRAIIKRDGDGCFYCGGPFGDDNPRSMEHLVARTHQGPDHISNLFLACVGCNRDAGHLSAPEKIRMRETLRAKHVATIQPKERTDV